MKTALIFLSVIVAVSLQQRHPTIVMLMPPWMSSFITQSVFRNNFNYRYYGDPLFNPRRRPVFFPTEKDVEARTEGSRFIQIEPRVKNDDERPDVIMSESDQVERMQQDPRFLINVLSRKSQFVFSTATATFTITSTCTSLRISTCVPRANFRPAAPAVVPNCRRKRQQLQSDDNQFSIVPTKVHPVLTTKQPIPTESAIGDGREMATLIASSKEEDGVQTADEQDTRQRQGRLLYYFLSRLNSLASTTITTWSVVSTTLTQTFVPAANFLCVPPGTVICSAAAGK